VRHERLFERGAPFREQLPGLGHVLIVVRMNVVGEHEDGVGSVRGLCLPLVESGASYGEEGRQTHMMPHTRKGLLARNSLLPSQAGATVTARKPSLPSLLRERAPAEE
jgi:hypothetical protein